MFGHEAINLENISCHHHPDPVIQQTGAGDRRSDPEGPHHAALLSQHGAFPGAFPKIYQVYDPGVSVSDGHNMEDGQMDERTDAVSPNRDT